MKQIQPNYPKARTEGIESTKVGDETIVYDTGINKAYCLSMLAKTVWEHCDGMSDAISIHAFVKNSMHNDVTLDMVIMAVEELEQTSLLEHTEDIDNTEKHNHNRRRVLEKLGKFAAASLPLITVVTIQPAVAQLSQSCGGVSCSKNSDCPGHNLSPPCNTKCIGGICVPSGSNCPVC